MNSLRIVWLVGVIISNAVQAANLSTVSVSGSNEALISFVGSRDLAVPTMKVDDNVIELTFTDADVEGTLKQMSELNSPHVLIRRIGTFATGKNVKSRIVLNGSVEDLGSRLHLTKENGVVNLTVNFPKGANATARLLGEEDKPIANLGESSKPIVASPSGVQFALVILVFLLAGAATYFFAKFLKRNGQIKGTRKFLIEQLSYCSIGPKTGVALLRVGSEFILVGVTPGQVTMLSSLQKLQEQYEGEAHLERKDFKLAVDEEFDRLKAARSSRASA